MTWFKIKHYFYNDPEFKQLNSNDILTWILCLNFATFHKTNGTIKRKDIKSFPKNIVPYYPASIRRLLKSNLIATQTQHKPNTNPTQTQHRSNIDPNTIYCIKGFEKYNRTKEQIEDITEKRREAGKKGGEQKAKNSLANCYDVFYPDTDTDVDVDNINTKNINKDSMNIKDRSIYAIIDYWCSIHHKDSQKRYKQGSSTWNKIKARLNEGFTETEIKQAIDEWHKKAGKHELAYICRNDEKIHDFISRAEKNGTVKPGENSFKPTPEEFCDE